MDNEPLVKNKTKDININWIDISKGIGIVLVVVGHYWIETAISKYIYLFHMPLFFFLSGYLFKPKNVLKRYFKKKFINLMLPYFSFLAIIGGIFYYEIFTSLSPTKILPYIKQLILGGPYLKGPLGVFWFITCLFFTQQVYNFLINRFFEKGLHIICIFLLSVAYINQYFFSSYLFPLAINVSCFSIPIFHLGYLYKKHSFELPAGIIFLSLVPLLVTFFIPENSIDMKNSYYGIVLISLILSLVLVISIIMISKFLEGKILGELLRYIGQRSLLIMFLHQPILYGLPFLNIYVLLIIALIAPIAVEWFFRKFSLTRLIFLGSYDDLKVINL